jgi:hypothetical protein
MPLKNVAAPVNATVIAGTVLVLVMCWCCASAVLPLQLRAQKGAKRTAVRGLCSQGAVQ